MTTMDANAAAGPAAVTSNKSVVDEGVFLHMLHTSFFIKNIMLIMTPPNVRRKTRRFVGSRKTCLDMMYLLFAICFVTGVLLFSMRCGS